ncbi:MAG: rod shape-determining protein RodA [Gammaproteobacteria bacterium]|nr:rod shape-determining protein RodA [Gammaproteobacteria bacterium]
MLSSQPRADTHKEQRSLAWKLHIDVPLLLGLLVLMGLAQVVLYSASGQDIAMVEKQVARLGLALAFMFGLAQVPPRVLKFWTLPLYVVGVLLLIAVFLVGDVALGAQRWLEIGGFRFQPSELMKQALPMMVAWYLSEHQLPPKFKHLAVAFGILALPILLIAEQPDLGTAVLALSSGLLVILLAGMSWKLIAGLAAAIGGFLPILWNFLMHDYQRRRVLTMLDPEADPVGAGYQIIQSKIAIGSGGIYGKGWLHGTQAQLEFIPEHHTDFIFAVLGEEFGLSGVLILIAVYLFIIARGLYIATQAQDSYSRLLAGAITLTFFVYVFVNIGMVSGILPVVGVPLPLVSYGGTSLVTLLAGFGMLMSIKTHRKLVSA